MTGIVGIISSREKDIEFSLNQMIAPLHRQDSHQVQKISMPNAGFASITFDGELTISSQGSLFLGVSGEIVDQNKLRAKLINQGDKNAYKYNLSELLLALYLQWGQEALCGLNGLYVLFIWDQNAQKLSIINDRYGICRLYYWKTNDRLMIASEYKAISWHPEFNKSVDELGLSDVLVSGHLMDDRTLFKDIKIVPMAHVITYQNNELSFTQYWDYDFTISENGRLGEEDYIDQLAYQIREAVRKRIHEKTCILLTGGLDARVIAGMFNQCAPQTEVKTYTIGHQKCKDGEYAHQIARNLGYDHTLIPVDETYIRNYAEECVWRAEGNLSILESWIFAGDEYLQKNHFMYAMSGVAGNLISGSRFTPDIMNAKNNDDIKRYILEGPRWHFKRAARILKPPFADQAVAGSFESIWQGYRRINSNNIPQKFNGLMCYQYERRHGSSADALGDYAKTLNPFFDNQLFDFVMRIPPKISGERTLYRKMQVKHISKVARVATIYDDLPIRISTWFDKHVFFRKAYYFPLRIKKHLAPPTELWDDPNEYVYPNTWLRTDEKDYIWQIIKKTEYLEDYLNMDEVKKMVHDHVNGIKREAGIIGAIITFALWRKRFCD